MTINPLISAYGAESVNPAQRPGNGRKSVGETAARPLSSQGQARVELSRVSSEMRIIRDELEKTPQIRLPLVEELRRKIANNDYPIENKLDQIAERLISPLSHTPTE